MTHNYLFAKSFFIAFLFSLFAGNAWAQDDTYLVQDVEEWDLSVETAEGDNLIVNIYSVAGWNAFVAGYNQAILYGKAGDASRIYSVFEFMGDSYSFSKVKTINIATDIECDPDFFITAIEYLPMGTTLTMESEYSITGGLTIDMTEEGEKDFKAILVNQNAGTIRNIRIRQLTVVMNDLGEHRTAEQHFSLICYTNNTGEALIENCEVVDVTFQVSDNNSSNKKCFSAIAYATGGVTSEDNPETFGYMENCLVSNFSVETTNTNINIYSAPLAYSNRFKEGDTNIKNCCVFIRDNDQISGNNHPFICNNKYENSEDILVKDIIDVTNRAFIYTGDVDGDNAHDYGELIVKFELRSDEYDDYGVNNNKTTYTTLEGFYAAIKDISDQPECEFDVIKYGDYNADEPDDRYFYNHPEFQSFYLPMVRELYALSPNADGKYDVNTEVQFYSMANMMANKDEETEMEFVLHLDVESPIPTVAVDVPTGCTIDGNGGAINDGVIGTPFNVFYREGRSIKPVFSTIHEGATIKRMPILIPKKEEGLYDIDPLKKGTSDYLFGFLAYENEGTIESCKVSYYEYESGEINSYIFGTELHNEGNYSIGGLVGENNGEIKNAVCEMYFNIKYNSTNGPIVNIGGIAGKNSHKISNVVFTASLDNVSGQNYNVIEAGGTTGLSTSSKTSLFAVNDDDATLENAFLVLSHDDFLSGGTFSIDEFTPFAKVLDEEDKVKIKTTGLEISSEEDLDADQISLDSKEGFLYTRSDKGDITLLYDSRLITTVETLAGAGILYKNTLCSYEADQAQATQVLTNFSNPSKWQYKRYEDEMGDLSLSMDGRDDDDITVRQEVDGTYSIASVSVFDADQFLQIGQSPAPYNTATISLEGNIDFSKSAAFAASGSVQLGTEGIPFRGKLKGNNFEMTGVQIDVEVSKAERVLTPKAGNSEQMEELDVACTGGVFGVLGEDAVVENVAVKGVVNAAFEDNKFDGVSNLYLPLLAQSNSNILRNVVASLIVNVKTDGLPADTKVIPTPVGNNGNNSTTDEEQAVMERVFIYAKNLNLLYKTPDELKSWWFNNEPWSFYALTFDEAYSFWCDFANYLKIYMSTMAVPTFESLATWVFGNITDEDVNAITSTDFDVNAALNIVFRFYTWYNDDAQTERRAEDFAAWEAYNESSSGNEVAVIATQNLCKSPGKGRTHKVCTAPAGGGNKSGIMLNPYLQNPPQTEINCDTETLNELIRQKYISYWFNFPGPGHTGPYEKLFSAGVFGPTLASAKSGAIVKLNYIVDGEGEQQAQSHGLSYETYAKEGSTVDLMFSDLPAGVRVNGTLLDASHYSADKVSFVVPQTPEGTDAVNVLIGFDHIPTALEEIDATEPAEASGISVQGNTLTVSAVEGQQIEVTDLRGVRIAAVKAVGNQIRITIPNRGIYVVKVGTQATKVAIK